jgi:hypothetical protein
VNSGYVLLVVCDVEGWSSRPAVAQHRIQIALSALMDKALHRIGIDGSTVPLARRGDGMILALPGTTDKARVTTTLVDAVRESLFSYAIDAGDDEQVRLPLVLHAGDVAIGDGEFAGRAIVQACRLVDSDVSRRVLNASRGAPLVLAVSDDWYRATVGEGYVPSAGFEQVEVQEKGFRGTAWIKVPGQSEVPGLTDHDRRVPDRQPGRSAREPRHGHNSISGGVFYGPVLNGTHFGGDYIQGDKYVGRSGK